MLTPTGCLVWAGRGRLPDQAVFNAGAFAAHPAHFAALLSGELWRTAAKTLQLGQRTVYLADALVRLPDGTAQPLTATERALLQKLAENRGHIVTYDAVCEAVWGADYYGYENSLNVHIRHLREKLEPNPSKPQYLLTVRGIGYKLAEENAQ